MRSSAACCCNGGWGWERGMCGSLSGVCGTKKGGGTNWPSVNVTALPWLGPFLASEWSPLLCSRLVSGLWDCNCHVIIASRFSFFILMRGPVASWFFVFYGYLVWDFIGHILGLNQCSYGCSFLWTKRGKKCSLGVLGRTIFAIYLMWYMVKGSSLVSNIWIFWWKINSIKSSIFIEGSLILFNWKKPTNQLSNVLKSHTKLLLI